MLSKVVMCSPRIEASIYIYILGTGPAIVIHKKAMVINIAVQSTAKKEIVTLHTANITTEKLFLLPTQWPLLPPSPTPVRLLTVMPTSPVRW